MTDEERSLTRKYPEYIEWRKAVYERDDYTCQVCFKRGGEIRAHHIEGYANNPELRIELSNGITMCKECHDNFHHKYSYYNNVYQQYIDFKER